MVILPVGRGTAAFIAELTTAPLGTAAGVWAAILLYLMARGPRGPGRVSLDHWIARRLGALNSTTTC